MDQNSLAPLFAKLLDGRLLSRSEVALRVRQPLVQARETRS